MEKRMRVIVSGGRDLERTEELLDLIAQQLVEMGATEVVSGTAPGGDTIGAEAGRRLGLHVEPFPFIQGVGRAGGPMRNTKMVEYADGLISLPGGSGTMDTLEKARRKGLKIVVLR